MRSPTHEPIMDDAATVFHVLQRRLGGDKCAADIEVEHAIKLLERSLLKGFRNGRAGIVYQYVKPAKGRHCLCNGSPDGFGIHRIRLDGNGFPAIAFDGVYNRRSRTGVFRVGYRHTCSIRGQALCDGGADAP